MDFSSLPIWAAMAVAVLAFGCASGPREVAKPVPWSGRWTNSLGMVFVKVPPAGVGFSIYETRVRDYEVFARTLPALDGTNWNRARYHGETPVSDGPDFPVVNVSWRDAAKFCEWLTESEHRQGILGPQECYRLPTDAEWSWAVGIGDREVGSTPKEKNEKLANVYPWGTKFPPPPGAGNFADEAAASYFTNWPHIAGYRDGFVTTSPVGSFQPNDYGLYDLAGNAMEWCADRYEAGHEARVLRGGAWINCGPRSLLSSARNHAGPGKFSVATGFRCVLAENQQR